MNVKTTIIVTAAHVANARAMGAALTPAGSGMYTTALSANGANPAIHYVSSGLIQEQFAALLADPVALRNAALSGAQAQGITLSVTQADVDALVATAIVHDGTHPTTGQPETPHELFARLGLKIVNEGAI